MATFYFTGAVNNTWDNTTLNWSATSGGTPAVSVPSTADTCIFDANSGSGTITTGAAISVAVVTLSTGFTGTVLCGTGNNFTVSGQVTVTQGTLNTNGQTCNWGGLGTSGTLVRAITFGASTITVTGGGFGPWGMSSVTNLTTSMASSTINMTGSAIGFQSNAAQFYGTVNFTGGSSISVSAAHFVNLTCIGIANKTNIFNPNNGGTVTGTLTLTGNSATNRLLFTGSGVTFTNTGATMNWSNVDCLNVPLTSSYNASAITGGCGDCGGNSNIIFTTSATQTWSGTSGGNWSANAWTTRVPLPQDDVVINAAFTATQTITADMPRLGRNINFTGATGTPTLAFSSTANTIYGSMTLISGMTVSGTNTITFAGVVNSTITSAGKSYSSPIIFNSPNYASTSWTLADAFSTSSTIQCIAGDLEANGQNVTCLSFSYPNQNNGYTRKLTMGSGTWSLTSTAATTVWSVASGSNLTVSAASSTITLPNASTNTRIFSGGGQSYGSLTYTVAGSTGTLSVSDANNFAALNFSDASNARTLTLLSAGTYNIGTFNVNGTAGKLMTLNSSTPGTAHILNYVGTTNVNVGYLSIQDSNPGQVNTWYAGHNSTFVSNTGNWIAGQTNSTTLTASMAMTGAEPKQTNVLIYAGMTLGGGLFRRMPRALSAAMSFSGMLFAHDAITRVIMSAALTLTGGIGKIATIPFPGRLSLQVV